MMIFRASLTASIACAAAMGAQAAVFTFDDEAAFLAATGATAQPAIPDVGSVGNPVTLGDLTLSTTSSGLIFGAAGFAWSDWSTVIPGNAFVISGVEDFAADFAAPVASFGFQVHEPTGTGSPPDATNTGAAVDSEFAVSLFSGGSLVGSAGFAPADDTLAFFGVWSSTPFDRVEVVETVGTNDNEYFGAFYTGTTPAPVPLPAGLPLMVAGLGALAALRRSSRRAGTG
jgi:hypothetical protein